jgi:hypothetical protein
MTTATVSTPRQLKDAVKKRTELIEVQGRLVSEIHLLNLKKRTMPTYTASVVDAMLTRTIFVALTVVGVTTVSALLRNYREIDVDLDVNFIRLKLNFKK